jgi:hypothetical protein
MTDFEIVKNYMDIKYPKSLYAMRKGNDCVWVSLNARIEMYFTIRDEKIVEIQVD